MGDLPVHIDVEASLGTFARREHIQRINGVKILKLAADLDRYARVIADTRPEVIVETGSRFGGSALWFAEHGVDVISVDADAGTRRPEHPRISWLLGDSAHPGLAGMIGRRVEGRRTMVVLDSDHSAPHVSREIALYGPLVAENCYLVVEDTIFGWAPNFQLKQLSLAPLVDFGTPLDAVEQMLVGNPLWCRDEDIERLHPVSHHPAGWWRRV